MFHRTSVTGARGCTTSTVMDGSQALPVSVTNCLNHSATTTYHPVLLQPETQTDANGQQTTTVYDELGRVKKITGPLDGASTFGSVSTYYYDWGNPNLQRVLTYRTEHHGSGNYVWSHEFFDGLGRTYMSQQEGPDSDKVIVPSYTTFDARGQVSAVAAPFFHHIGSNSSDPLVWTSFTYDVLGRPRFTYFPDGTSTCWAAHCSDERGEGFFMTT